MESREEDSEGLVFFNAEGEKREKNKEVREN